MRMNEEGLKKLVIEALRHVEDPELHIDIYTLGLIYDVRVEEDGVSILMTLTTPLCPYAREIEDAVRKAGALSGLPVCITVTFDPPWNPPQDLRAILGL